MSVIYNVFFSLFHAAGLLLWGGLVSSYHWSPATRPVAWNVLVSFENFPKFLKLSELIFRKQVGLFRIGLGFILVEIRLILPLFSNINPSRPGPDREKTLNVYFHTSS